MSSKRACEQYPAFSISFVASDDVWNVRAFVGGLKTGRTMGSKMVRRRSSSNEAACGKKTSGLLIGFCDIVKVPINKSSSNTN